MWRALAIVALLWPGRVSAMLDGAPLNHLFEAALLGLAVPVLAWLHPRFLCHRLARSAIAGILLLKLFAVVALQQEGWCVAFDPPRAMVRDSTGKPHSWDIRADWLSTDPQCSAILTRAYHDTFEVPAWFFNLPPPDDAVVRAGFSPGEMRVRMIGSGYLTVRRAGTLRISAAEPMEMRLRVDGSDVPADMPGQYEARLDGGRHRVEFDGVLLSKTWQVVPTWDGVEMGSMRFPLATIAPPSRLQRAMHPVLNFVLLGITVLFIGGWAFGALASVRSRELLVWSASAAIAIALVCTYLPAQAPWYCAAASMVTLLLPMRPRLATTRGLFFLVIVPWLTFIVAINAHMAGRWTLYGIGNDNFQFQRFAYRIFLQGFWLEGGQVTFWNQPLFRWIAGALHLVFGDSSVGQVYWDAGGVVIFMLFAYHVVRRQAGFAWAVASALIPMTMFLLGPSLEFVGFGLSEISSAALIYLAAVCVLRARGAGALVAAGVLVMLGFFARLNNLPMASAVTGFALPITVTAADVWRPKQWLPLVRWRVVAAIGIGLCVGALLLAWRTWHYTGVFSMFYGTQREHLAVWKTGMSVREALAAMVSSVMMVLTGQDPPRFAWYSVPLLGGAIISTGAVCGVPVLRRVPLAVVAFFLAGVSSALVTRGWAYEGRFSIHLYGAAAALCVWIAADVTQRISIYLPAMRRILFAALIFCLMPLAVPQAQQGTLSTAEMQRRRDLEAKLQEIAVVDRRVMIPMRDGVRLATDIYRPKNASGKVPIIFVKTPYNMNFWDVRNGVPADMSRIIEAIEKGYAYVGQNERGHFYSEGNYDILGAPITDGYETIDYLTKQPWSNGKLGTTGCSSTAEWQPAVASLGHPGFAAMNVQGFGAGVGKVGPYWEQGNWYRGGAMQMLFITWIYGEQNQVRPMFPKDTPREDLIAASKLFDLAPRMPPVDWDKALWHLPTQDIIKSVEGPRGIFADKMPVETGGMMQQREPASDAWRKGGLWHDDMALNVPGLWFMSWYDVSVGPNLEMFNHVRRTAKAPTRDQQYAIIAPVAHCSYTRATEHTIVGERDMGDARLDYNDITYAFFDKFLKGDANGRIEKMARVTYYTMGSNKWQTSEVWPPAAAQPMTLHLSSGGHANSLTGDGQLLAASPDADAPDVFTYDPMNPVTSYGGNVCCTGNAVQAGSFDQRKMESRNDILVYTSEAFKEGIEVSGPIVPTLYVSSDAKDTDFTVKVLDVYPDGRAYNLDESIQRMRYREGYDKKVWMEKDKIYKVTLQPLNTSNYFAAGHRLRIEVSSSNFPRFDRNLNTGGNNFDEAKGVIARNVVHHAKQYPSSITLSVVRQPAATARP